ncbi:MAG: hypothetical protein RL748_2227 [Pseudomonadota bacterium]|jgi:serine protease Do
MKTRNSSLSKALAAISLSVAGCFFAPAMVGWVAPVHAGPSAGLPDFTDLVEKSGPGVVNIRTTVHGHPGAQGLPGFPGLGGDEDAQEFFRRFFGNPGPRQPQPNQPNPKNRRTPAPQQQEEEYPRGVGSGFIISSDGYVLTNAHVVEGADEVYVKLTDKREFKAKVIGTDRRTDVAVLKIDASNLPRLTLGDSSKSKVGEWVIAIGSPFDLENTVTAGIISAKARETGELLPFIQTDVAVNPGNSGGPLINMRNEVIGINSQIYSRSGGYQGISLAIPIEEAVRVADQLRATGKVSRGRIGVAIGEVSKDVAESIGLGKPRGAAVGKVEAGTPAEKAGIEAGDVILKFNGQAIEKANDLSRAVAATKPGSRASVTVWRKGANKELTLTVAEMEGDKNARRDDKKAKPEANANALGLSVSDLSEAQKRDLKLAGGVVVDAADGISARAGLRAGDIITQINVSEVKDAKQFAALVAKLDSKKTVALLVRRGEQTQFVTIKPGAQ